MIPAPYVILKSVRDLDILLSGLGPYAPRFMIFKGPYYIGANGAPQSVAATAAACHPAFIGIWYLYRNVAYWHHGPVEKTVKMLINSHSGPHHLTPVLTNGARHFVDYARRLVRGAT